MCSSSKKGSQPTKLEATIPENVYPVIDTDLARDNLENDLPEADRQDLDRPRGKK